MDNFDAKFGAQPPPPPVSEWSRNALVLAVQFFVCAAILIVVKPPFVTRKEGIIEMERVVAVAGVACLSTSLFFASGVAPSHSFMRSCEFLYRMAKG